VSAFAPSRTTTTRNAATTESAKTVLSMPITYLKLILSVIMVECETPSRQRVDSDDGSVGRAGPFNGSPRMLKVLGVLAASVCALLISTTIKAQEAAVQRGRAFAEANCSRCHAVGPAGASPLSKAPPFRTLYQRYPVEDLAEALAEGIRTAHPAMPEFELNPHQIDDLIAYLKSLNG